MYSQNGEPSVLQMVFAVIIRLIGQTKRDFMELYLIIINCQVPYAEESARHSDNVFGDDSECSYHRYGLCGCRRV